MAKSPIAIPFSTDSVEMGVKHDTALPADTRGFIGVGFDGTYTRFIRTDDSGNQYVLSSQLPAALVGGRLDTNIGAWLGSTDPTVGQKAMATSIPVAVSSDQSAIPVKGTDAHGALPTESPVLVAGWDGTNVSRVKTNTSGRVEQVLYDGAGNPVAVILDNSIYRLETRTTVVGQALGAGAEKKVTIIDDLEVANEVRLQTESRLAPGSQVNIGTVIPADPATLYLGFMEDSGGSENLLVNGDPTPVEFSFVPDAGVVVSLQSVLLVFTADDFSFDGASFGPNSKLTNGISIEVTVNSVNSPIFTIFQNEDFLRIPGRLPLVNNTGPKDLLGAVLVFGGLIQLVGDNGDKITVTVQDDLTSVKLKYLTATMYGIDIT